jgi:hypothetical protein
MSKHRQWPGLKGQSYVAAPEFPSYDRPPASDVTIVRRDSTQETRLALAGEPAGENLNAWLQTDGESRQRCWAVWTRTSR